LTGRLTKTGEGVRCYTIQVYNINVILTSVHLPLYNDSPVARVRVPCSCGLFCEFSFSNCERARNRQTDGRTDGLQPTVDRSERGQHCALWQQRYFAARGLTCVIITLSPMFAPSSIVVAINRGMKIDAAHVTGSGCSFFVNGNGNS